MDIEELRKECEQYIENQKQKGRLFLENFKNIQAFCKKINDSISDNLYNQMIESYKYREALLKGEKTGPLTIDEIIKITETFLGNVSEGLKNKFKVKLANGLIKIDKKLPDKCIYFSKNVNGIEIHDNIICINYTGTIYDVLTLVHEFFHSLTDTINYKKEIKIDKDILATIQETISILAEFICADYLKFLYPNIITSDILFRIYDQVYIQCQSAKVMVHYLNLVMGGASLEQLNKTFVVEEIRKKIQEQSLPMSIEHFIGTMVSISTYFDEKEPNKLLNEIYEKIENEKLKDVVELVPMNINASKVIGFLMAKENTKKV